MAPRSPSTLLLSSIIAAPSLHGRERRMQTRAGPLLFNLSRQDELKKIGHPSKKKQPSRSPIPAGRLSNPFNPSEEAWMMIQHMQSIGYFFDLQTHLNSCSISQKAGRRKNCPPEKGYDYFPEWDRSLALQGRPEALSQ